MTRKIAYQIALAYILLMGVMAGLIYFTSFGNHAGREVPTKEIISRRADNSFVFANKDGSLTSVVYADAVNYKDTQGNWRHVDTSIRNAQTTETPFKARFGSNGRLSFLFDDELIEFVPLQTKTSKGITTTNKIVYPGLYEDCDLRYTVEPNRLKEEIILRTPEAPKSFIFAIRYEKRLPRIVDGALDFGSFRTMPPIAIDAKGRQGQVAAVIKKINGKTCLVFGVDPEWAKLASYPIIIDPTIVIQPDELAGKDAFISEDDPMANHGDDERMRVAAGAPHTRSYIQFDLATIPPSANVSAAMLQLYVEQSDIDSLHVRRVLQPWEQTPTGNADGLNWSNQPTFGEIVGSAQTVPAAEWVGIDIEDVVADWIAGRVVNHGVIVLGDEIAGSGQAVVYSSNYAGDPLLRPKLEVTYTLESDKPAAKISSIKDNDHIRGQQITLSGTATDGEKGSGITRVEISINNGETWETAGGNESWSYEWNTGQDAIYAIGARAVDNAGNIQSEPAFINIIVDNTLPTAEIDTPAEGSRLEGKVLIHGTASDENLDNYVVEYGLGSEPETFTKIGAIHKTSVHGVLLEYANPVNLNGTYVFKLTVTDKAGNVSRTSRTVTLQNPVTLTATPHRNYRADSDLCALCHRSHISLSGKLNYWVEPESTYCNSCHHGIAGAENIKAQVEESKSNHPIKDRTFMNDPSHTMDCHQCHDPHGNKRQSGVDPSAGATDVPLNASPTIRFSEPMSVVSINSDTFILVDGGGGQIMGAVSYDELAKVAKFDPTQNLSPGMRYTAKILSSVTDAAGNQLGKDFDWSFTTVVQ